MTAIPTLVSPVNGSTAIPTDGQTFTWDAYPNAQSYEMEYSTYNDFSDNVGFQTVTATNTQLFGLDAHTTYYWRVRAANGIDFSPWSGAWSFTTENCQVTEDIEITTCDSYTWNNTTYYQSGSYTETFISNDGCDSVVTLQLTLSATQHSDDYATICIGQLPYPYGDTFFETGTTSGDYDVTFASQNGCDSIVTLHLTVVTAINYAITATACGNYVWNGITYNQSGIYQQTFTNQYGCDSIVTLDLTISDILYETLNMDACESYLWNNQTYTQSGSYEQTFTSSNGCDSVVTLNLTIHHPVDFDTTVTACDSYIWNNQLYTTSGTFVQTFGLENGCDSTVTLHLTINQSIATSEAVTACESYVWDGQVYTESGTYEQVFSAASGCDSTVTLQLSITHPGVSYDTIAACDSYEWHGEVLTESGDYTWTDAGAAGCESTENLHLVIHHSAEESVTVEAFNEYVWNGNHYSMSGDYTWTGQTEAGCDSTVTLHLTIIYEDGVSEYGDGGSIRIWPNPVKSVCKVRCDDVSDMTDIQVFDISGKLLFTQKATGNEIVLDFSGRAPGLYLLRILSNERIISTTKVVKE